LIQKLGNRSLDAGAWYMSVDTRWWDSALHKLENRSLEKDDYSVYRLLIILNKVKRVKRGTEFEA
jgi:hypothetical protein